MEKRTIKLIDGVFCVLWLMYFAGVLIFISHELSTIIELLQKLVGG